MQLNALPPDYQGEQKRRTEFQSAEDKLAYDAKNLVMLAREKYKRQEVTVAEIKDSMRRSNIESGADNEIKLHNAICAYLVRESKAAEINAQIAIASEEPRLQGYRSQYERWNANLKGRCPWQKIKSRLLANEGRYLILAEGMNEGGVLFGLDKENNPLFADGGDEPIMKGVNYFDTRDRVRNKFDDHGEMIKVGEKPVSTGYEMFSADEVSMFEEFTGKPFVTSCSLWLESGEDPGGIHSISYNVDVDECEIWSTIPQSTISNRGVRRLLRVKEGS